MTPQAFNAVHMLIQSRLNADTLDMEEPVTLEDLIPQMTIEGSTAIIPIKGVIANKVSLIEKSLCGVVDIRDINANLEKAVADANVTEIALDMDTPGGSTDFIEQTAKRIADINKNIKPVCVYTDDMLASAGMYLASGADSIYANPAASAIGSVGVYCAYLDQSLAFAKDGLQMQVFSAGKYKAQGFPGTALSDDFKAYLQDSVNKTYEQFTNHIKSTRPQVSMEDMQGLVYDAEEALEKGFIDGIVNQISDIFYTD